MATTVEGIRALVRRYRVHAEAVGVALLAIVVFLALGVRARRALGPLRADATRLSMTASEITRFRAAFAPSPQGQDLRLAQRADSLGVSVSRDERVALAQQVAARAEALGLTNVRVKFAPRDTGVAPARPELAAVIVAVADYSLSVDCDGNLAAVLSLVNQLPASVALQRITAAKVGGTTRYRLTFAVFESAGTAVGGAGQHG